MLQAINAKGPRDYRILQCAFWYEIRTGENATPSKEKWIVETLTRMVSTGIGKAELIEKIGNLAKEKTRRMGQAKNKRKHS